MIAAVRAELARTPWIWRGVVLTASAAFGTALPDVIALVHRVLS